MKVSVLGRLDVADHDGPVAVAGTKQRGLLVLLAVNAGRAVSADRLVDELWRGDTPQHAANALQHQVSRLRKLLGPERVVARPPGYLLDVPPEDVDALRFEHLAAAGRGALREGDHARASATLRAALSLWRGSPFEEFPEADWAREEAARLEQVHVTALEDRFDADLALGQHVELVGQLETAARAHPFRERLWAQLMLALYRAGRQADALATFQRARQLLVDEHGLDPGPELQQLETQILAHDPAIGAPVRRLATRTADGPRDAAPGPDEAPEPGNLPEPLTRLVGRAGALNAVTELTVRARLVTLTGPGGVGKTRLATEAARALADEFPAGRWLVDVASAADPEGAVRLVAETLAARRPGSPAMRSPETPGTPPLERIVARLHARPALLLLDGCEHLVDTVAELVQSLLGLCPALHVLATSRQPLGLVGEVRWATPPLSVPPPLVLDPEELAQSPAVQLFVERARAVQPTFAVLADDAPLLAGLCRTLDGLPLAVELAAARVSSLPVGHIATALDDRFQLLVRGSRTAPARQRSLRATMDWSYELLSDDERDLFEALAVFPGGCSLEAAQWMAGATGVGPADAVIQVSDLVDKSLALSATGSAGEPRFDMLDTIRAYGVEQLRRRGRWRNTRRRQAELMCRTAQSADRALRGPDHRHWLRLLEDDRPNLRAALDHSVAEGDARTAVQLAASLAWFFAVTDRHAEGRAWVETALATATSETPPHVRGYALTVLAYLAGQQRDLARALPAAEEGARLLADAEDPWQRAVARSTLALICSEAGRPAEAPELLAAARADYERAGDDWGLAACALVEAVASMHVTDVDSVDWLAAEVTSRATRIHYEPFRIWALMLRAWVAERRGRPAQAADAHDECLVVARRLDQRHYVAFLLAELGRHAANLGAGERAERLQREAVGTAGQAGSPWFAAFARHALAVTLRGRGSASEAQALDEQVVAWSEGPGAAYGRETFFLMLGGSPAARAHLSLAEDAEDRGDGPAAETHRRAGLARADREQDSAAAALALSCLAATEAAMGHGERAAILLGAAQAVRGTSGASALPGEDELSERTEAYGAARVPRARWQAALARGRSLTPADALGTAGSD